MAESAEHAPGTRVWFATNAGMAPGDGSLAEWCAVPAADLVPISEDVPDAAVAAIGTSGIAAWMALTWRAGLAAGERVVVLGANGTVGQVALAVARERGAGRVVAVCRSDSAAGRAQECGAHDVVVLDPAEERAGLTGRLVEAAGGPVDVVIDPVFGEPAAAAALALGPGGRLVNLGGSAHDLADFSSAALRGSESEHPRLHQQRDLARAAGRGADLGAGPRRPRAWCRSTTGCCRWPSATRPGRWPVRRARGSWWRSADHASPCR